MRPSTIGWFAAAIVAAVMGTALLLMNQRIAALEGQLDKVDSNFLQLSVPVEESARDISVLYSEVDELRRNASDSDTAPSPARQAVRRSDPPPSVVPQKARPFRAPEYYAPDPTSEEMQGADGLTGTDRQRQIQARNGVFNDFSPDEDNDD